MTLHPARKIGSLLAYPLFIPEAAMIRFACPMCNAAMAAPDDRAGSKGTCPKCGQRIQVPKPPPANKTVVGKLLDDQPASAPFKQVDASVATIPPPPPSPGPTILCPRCHQSAFCPPELLGWTVSCPSCGESLTASGHTPVPSAVAIPTALPINPAPQPQLGPFRNLDDDSYCTDRVPRGHAWPLGAGHVIGAVGSLAIATAVLLPAFTEEERPWIVQHKSSMNFWELALNVNPALANVPIVGLVLLALGTFGLLFSLGGRRVILFIVALLTLAAGVALFALFQLVFELGKVNFQVERISFGPAWVALLIGVLFLFIASLWPRSYRRG
jgi:hypothetical protein